MDDSSTITVTLDQTDEEILTSTVSDEALEAAAGPENGAAPSTNPGNYSMAVCTCVKP